MAIGMKFHLYWLLKDWYLDKPYWEAPKPYRLLLLSTRPCQWLLIWMGPWPVLPSSAPEWLIAEFTGWMLRVWPRIMIRRLRSEPHPQKWQGPSFAPDLSLTPICSCGDKPDNRKPQDLCHAPNHMIPECICHILPCFTALRSCF